MDIDLEYMAVDEFIERMNGVLPKDIQIISGKYLEREESLNSIIAWGEYEIQFQMNTKRDMEEVNELLTIGYKRKKSPLLKLEKEGAKDREGDKYKTFY